jgi:DNA-binding LacI/PurR family transcriptional regulator
MSVAGYDDTVGLWLHPGLTTIHEFPEQLGKQMVEMILNRIVRPDDPPQRVTLPTEFIKRDSCRPISASQEAALEEPLRRA